MLEPLIREQGREFDVDTLLLYEDGTPLEELRRAVGELVREGRSVMAQRALPGNVRCRRVLKFEQGEVKPLE